jgi:acetyl esterase/lipase
VTHNAAPSWQARIFDLLIRGVVRRRHWGDERALTRRARVLFGAPAPIAWFARLGLRFESVRDGDIRGEWLTPSDPAPGLILYVHGGGFVSCSPATHRPIAAALARLTRRRVFSVAYRLAPEARLPAAHDDVGAAYEWLLRTGEPSSRIAVVGDSAGGNLVLAVTLRLRDRARPLPACLVAFSPWMDLTGISASVRLNDGDCAMFRPENMRDFASAALGERAPGDPDVSPVYAPLHGLPPMLLHAGSSELPRDDAVRVYDRIRAHGGSAELVIYPGVPHGWQMLAPFVPEATHSLRAAAAFIARHIGQSTGDWRRSGCDTLAEDALAALRLLKTSRRNVLVRQNQ